MGVNDVHRWGYYIVIRASLWSKKTEFLDKFSKTIDILLIVFEPKGSPKRD